jgi:hypothetical protein
MPDAAIVGRKRTTDGNDVTRLPAAAVHQRCLRRPGGIVCRCPRLFA